MRFATFTHAGSDRTGVVVGSSVHPLPPGTKLLKIIRHGGLEALLDAGTAALALRGIPLANVRLRPPVQPPTARDFVTFEAHMEGMVRRSGGPEASIPAQWYEAPTFYSPTPTP